MSYQLAPFSPIGLDEALLETLISEHESVTLPRLRRLWSYYRNALAEPNSRGGSMGAPAQSAGLPPRLQGPAGAAEEGVYRREVVVENDIAWRLHTLVDFMFPEAPKITSKAADTGKAQEIEAIIHAVIGANGGAALWQDAALLGSVYGQIDFLVNVEQLDRIGAAGGHGKFDSGRQGARSASGGLSAGASHFSGQASRSPDAIAKLIGIETIEAPRAIALLNRNDYRRLDAYILYFEQLTNAVERGGLLSRLGRSFGGRPSGQAKRASVTVVQIISDGYMQRYEGGRLVKESINRLGRIPVVHVQNLSQPLAYAGLSDVEPLIPLQDELNTRLSDRANRVTMQSFRMWLGKGIENFTDQPIGPGQMWMTDNLDASIEPFGGDAHSPSERAHIEELREALDKASGVTPAAAGHIRARVGNLTSENALRISLMGTIAKTKRKRVTYGAGIAQLCELILHALDVYGIYRTHPEEREVDIVWADPIAADESRRIADALSKAQLGVPMSLLRAELGYADADNGGGDGTGV